MGHKTMCKKCTQLYNQYRRLVDDCLVPSVSHCSYKREKEFRYELTSDVEVNSATICYICKSPLDENNPENQGNDKAGNGKQLCTSCNAALGQFQESSDNLLNAVIYLLENGSSTTGKLRSDMEEADEITEDIRCTLN